MAHIFTGDFSRLESNDRKKILPAKKILDSIGIKKNDTIIDFGCGIGYFSIPATQYAKKVIAIDLSEDMLKELKKRTVGINNIELVKSDNIVGFKGDIILVVTVFHEVDEPKTFLNNCFKSLNPGGRVIIIDWQKKETEGGPPINHRISKDEVIQMTNIISIEHSIHPFFYFLDFRK